MFGRNYGLAANPTAPDSGGRGYVWGELFGGDRAHKGLYAKHARRGKGGREDVKE